MITFGKGLSAHPPHHSVLQFSSSRNPMAAYASASIIAICSLSSTSTTSSSTPTLSKNTSNTSVWFSRNSKNTACTLNSRSANSTFRKSASLASLFRLKAFPWILNVSPPSPIGLSLNLSSKFRYFSASLISIADLSMDIPAPSCQSLRFFARVNDSNGIQLHKLHSMSSNPCSPLLQSYVTSILVFPSFFTSTPPVSPFPAFSPSLTRVAFTPSPSGLANAHPQNAIMTLTTAKCSLWSNQSMKHWRHY